ncbi:MAG TPA: hypothetical protein VFR81_29850, partial [Longimicrobium sp.]|nr:hypothetical protein [Longimicrobium sp.]
MAKAHTLVDNFNDNSIDAVLWSAYGGTQAREVNQRVEIRVPGSTGGSTYAGISSQSTYDLTGSEVRVELVQAYTPRVPGEAYLQAGASSGNVVSVIVTEGNLSAAQGIGGTWTHLVIERYDPARHRWLRIRERSGTTYWETSADGCEWELLHSKANPITLTAVTLEIGAGTWQGTASPGVVVFDNFNVRDTSRARRVEERRLSAREVRDQASDVAAARRHDEHVNNNDEVNYPTRPLVGSYSKSLKHDALGDPDPASYGTLLRALQSEDPADFDEIQLASSTALKLTNPQSGLAFDVAGPDAQERTIPPAPRFDSDVAAHEMGELYWMAVARHVAFVSYGTDAKIAAAVTSLNNEFPQFGGTTPVTVQNVFRGI